MTSATHSSAELPQAPPSEGADRERRLREVTLAISSSVEIGQILEQVVRLSMELLGADAGALPLYDAQRDVLLPSHTINMKIPVSLKEHRRGVGVIWDVVDSGRPYLNNQYSSDARALSSLLAWHVHAVLGVPVTAGGEMLGVLIMYHSVAERTFSQDDQELLETIGRQAGVAIRNARLYATAVREADRRALLYSASLSFGAALTTGGLYVAIHRAAASLMPCDICVIALLDAERQEIVYVYLVDRHGPWPIQRLPLSRGLLGYITRTGVSLRIRNCDAELESWFGSEPFGDGVAEDATGSLLAVPLLVGDRPIGALTIQTVAPDIYSADDLDALETLAATAAIAVQNAQLFAQVQELATRDPLTGVFNRRHFFQLASSELERAARYRHPVSLLMLDADYFKRINDTYGHLAGDQVLQAITARCREALREIDVVARYGGEEFLVLLPETGPADALLVAERLRERIGREPVSTDVGPVDVRVTLGVASYEQGQPGTVDQLLDRVDKALYAAKGAGRNQTRAYVA